MKKFKKLLIVFLGLGIFINLYACGGTTNSSASPTIDNTKYEESDTFKQYDVSNDGLLKWNAIKEAKYYKIYDKYITNTSYQLKKSSDHFEERKVKVEAYKVQTDSGLIDSISIEIVIQDDTFRLKADALTYTATVLVNNKTMVLSNIYLLNKDDINIELHKLNYMTSSSFYLDEEYTKKLTDEYWLTDDVTIYTKNVVDYKLNVTIYSFYDSIFNPKAKKVTLNKPYIDKNTIDLSYWNGNKYQYLSKISINGIEYSLEDFNKNGNIDLSEYDTNSNLTIKAYYFN